MKKSIFIGTILVLFAFKVNAQDIGVNYIQNFIPEYDFEIKKDKLIPVTESQFLITYTQNLKKSPLVLNFSIAASRKKPPLPRYIKIPDPWKPFSYAEENNIEADEARFSKSNTTSIDFLAGVGYVLPHKAGSKFTLSANLDFGVSLNNKQTLDYYFQNTKTGTLEMVNNQFIINPYLKLKYSITNRFGINIGSGYSNLGGFNLSSGIVFNPFGDKNCPHRRCCGNCDPDFRPNNKK